MNEQIPHLNLQLTYRLPNDDRDVLLDTVFDNVVNDYNIHQDLNTALFGVEKVQGDLVNIMRNFKEKK